MDFNLESVYNSFMFNTNRDSEMSVFSKFDPVFLKEEFGDDVVSMLAWASGCNRHSLGNSSVNGWIIDDETLRQFAVAVVDECREVLKKEMQRLDEIPGREISAQTFETAHLLIKKHFNQL